MIKERPTRRAIQVSRTGCRCLAGASGVRTKGRLPSVRALSDCWGASIATKNAGADRTIPDGIRPYRAFLLMKRGVACPISSRNSRTSLPGASRARLIPSDSNAIMIATMSPSIPPSIPLSRSRRDTSVSANRGGSSTVMTGVSRTSRILASSRLCSRVV